MFFYIFPSSAEHIEIFQDKMQCHPYYWIISVLSADGIILLQCLTEENSHNKKKKDFLCKMSIIWEMATLLQLKCMLKRDQKISHSFDFLFFWGLNNTLAFLKCKEKMQ